VNSRERFRQICKHRPPDRFPIDYMAAPEIDARLKQHYNVQTEAELLDILGCDFYYLPLRDITQNESFLPFYKGPEIFSNDKERTCPFGIRYERTVYRSKFAVDRAIEGPLEKTTSSEEIIRHPWPRPNWFTLEPLLEACETNNDKNIIGGLWTGILGDSYRLIGFENFLMNMALHSELIRTLVNRITECYMELNESIFSTLKGKMDIWFFGNDFATQQGLMFSVMMFEEFFLENIRKLTTLAKNYDLKVMAHSCGAISELLPLLIDSGIDIIDPVQTTAAGMEAKGLSAEFGEDLIFHGGIDTQYVLPEMQPDEVYDHAFSVMNDLGQQNGYIFAPSQILRSDIPIDNIAAMYQAARDFRPDQKRKPCDAAYKRQENI